MRLSATFRLLVITVAAAYIPCSAYAQHLQAEMPKVPNLSGNGFSSVAWSPDGKYIAFVASPLKALYDESMTAPLNSSIWLWPVQAKMPPMRMLSLKEAQGIPTSLFWLSNDSLGWSAAWREGEKGFTFFTAKLGSSKYNKLMDMSYHLVQGDVGIYAPTDVYFVRGARELIFDGGVDTSDTCRTVVLLFAVDTHTLDVAPLHPSLGGLVALCGIWSPKTKLVRYYFWGTKQSKPGYFKNILWSNGYPSMGARTIITQVTGILPFFPRISPNGRLLAWLGGNEPHRADIIVRDLSTGRQKTLGSLSELFGGIKPEMGCPFSWSPDGKQIAYADGNRIRIIDVPADPGGKKK